MELAIINGTYRDSSSKAAASGINLYAFQWILLFFLSVILIFSFLFKQIICVKNHFTNVTHQKYFHRLVLYTLVKRVKQNDWFLKGLKKN